MLAAFVNDPSPLNGQCTMVPGKVIRDFAVVIDIEDYQIGLFAGFK
jgi:hypothetical protein